MVAQALARQATIESETYATLNALGVSRRQLAVLGMTATFAVAVTGRSAESPSPSHSRR